MDSNLQTYPNLATEYDSEVNTGKDFQFGRTNTESAVSTTMNGMDQSEAGDTFNPPFQKKKTIDATSNQKKPSMNKKYEVAK